MTYWCDRGVDAWRLDAAYAVPAGVLARGAAAGARAASRRVGRRRGAARRLRRLRRGVGHRLGDPVRALEGGLELAQRPQPLRAGPRPGPARRDGRRASCRRPSSATTTSPGWPAGSTTPGTCPLALALLFALPGVPTVYYGDEFGAARASRRTARVGTTPSGPRAAGERTGRPDREAAAVADLHRLLIGVRRRHPWLVDAAIEEPDVLTNEVLAVRLTAGEDSAGRRPQRRRRPGRRRAAVRRGCRGGRDRRAAARGRREAVRVPPHGFALVGAGADPFGRGSFRRRASAACCRRRGAIMCACRRSCSWTTSPRSPRTSPRCCGAPGSRWSVAAERGRRPAPGASIAPGPRRARRAAARAWTGGRCCGRCGRSGAGADHPADPGRGVRRAGDGAGGGRRRLPEQALRPARAGGAHPGGAAPAGHHRAVAGHARSGCAAGR